MYTREEKKNNTAQFWNSFGLYMKKYNQRYGRVRWVNYRSNVKDIYFRLSITDKGAKFAIELQHKDDGIRELFYEQFKALKTVLHQAVGDDLEWKERLFNQHEQAISSIYLELKDVSIYNRDDWQKIFQFFEKKMTGLHDFWEEFGEVFKELED